MNGETLLEQLRAARRATLERFSGLESAALSEARPWNGAQFDLRFRLSWLAEGDEARRIRIQETRVRLGNIPAVAEQALVVGAEARGRLLGLLVGLDERRFEQAPALGEWSVRQILGHVIATDLRYLIAVEYAVTRQRNREGGPLRPPDSALPPRSGEAESAGTMSEVLSRMAGVRDRVIRQLGRVPDELLDAPTNWLHWDLDVRFRIHRFAAHDREHGIQIRNTLQTIGFDQSEPQLLLANAAAARSALEAALICVPSDLLELSPPGGGPAIAAIVKGAVEDERAM